MAPSQWPEPLSQAPAFSQTEKALGVASHSPPNYDVAFLSLKSAVAAVWAESAEGHLADEQRCAADTHNRVLM